MLLTAIVAGLAGWASRHCDAQIAGWLLPVLGEDALESAVERRVAALLVTLLGAAVALALLDAEGSVLAFSLGAALGYFFEQLRARFERRS